MEDFATPFLPLCVHWHVRLVLVPELYRRIPLLLLMVRIPSLF